MPVKHPYHKGIARIEARKYISYNEAEEKRDAILLEFAKIDFNMLKSLRGTMKWRLIKSKVTYTRHRIAEGYLWLLGAYFEPRYSQARVKTSIALILFTTLDDMYDAYGTMEGLFTDAMEKKYMHPIMVDFYDKLEEEIENQGRSGCGFHLKKPEWEMSDVANLDAFEWLSSNPKIRVASKIIRFTDDMTVGTKKEEAMT
ncbi:hypothetical protein F2Q69_00060842 [Brassica cretica]|uniref:Terpene synthase metal-binding domain-containing protein n=1 Tax=Brassica cretica TaxID=69181 RepID=A0A8S9RNT5_BRACR|nr:hypothetical protein F2Q69_00060842 [Brassica cretica]